MQARARYLAGVGYVALVTLYICAWALSTSTRQAPRFAERGSIGTSMEG